MVAALLFYRVCSFSAEEITQKYFYFAAESSFAAEFHSPAMCGGVDSA